MSARDIVLSSGGSAAPVYVDDVFSTYLYTGTGALQTINNGIDLAGKGGLVWNKSRSATWSNYLQDTTRGIGNELSSDSTGPSGANGYVSSVSSTGFTLGISNGENQNGATYVSWTFRKQPKFFDIVTYTGNATNPRTISHSLGSVPGMVIIKRTDTTGDWWVYHNGITVNQYLKLNTTDTLATSASIWGTGPTSSGFTVNAGAVNALGGTYVAYLFAHNAGGFGTLGTDNVISCGTFTTDAAGASSLVNLGYEPQWILYKSTTNSTLTQGAWQLVDSMRGLNSGSTVPNEPVLFPNNSNTESAWPVISVSATGFQTTGQGYLAPNSSFIYIAIRRPNKPPTTGTQVYKSIARTGTGAIGTSTGFGNVTDLVISSARTGTSKSVWTDRLRGATKEISSSDTLAEAASLNDITGFDSMTGFKFGTGASGFMNTAATTYIDHLFKRAKGFMDIVCYVGTGTNLTLNHNLEVIPQLIIGIDRSIGQTRPVGGSILPNTNFLILNTTAASSSTSNVWNNTSPTASVFTVGASSSWINNAGDNNVAYLFATLAGISKVGSYTGNGTSQTIACGFTTGARFIMIKRTNSTGDWYIWDSARGIVSANDPHLSLNSTAAEVTTDDSVDPDNSGFIVNQVVGTDINVTSSTYIFLAIA